MYKQKSIVFPNLEVASESSSPAVISHDYVLQTQRDFRETLSFAHAFCEFVTEKYRTEELEKQIAYKKAALDAEIAENEEQLRISFENLNMRLNAEYDEKYKELEIELQKEMAVVETRLKEQQINYETYVRTSAIHKRMFDLVRGLCDEVTSEIESVQAANSPEKLKQSKYYLQLCEAHRRLLAETTSLLRALI